jgi:hypothetical protein
MRIVLGHPVVIIGGLLVTLVAAAFLVSRVEPEYEAKSSVLLHPPSETETQQGRIVTNPLENPGRTSVTANAMVDIMHSPPVAQQLAERGMLGDYEVIVSPTGGGATLAVRTTGPTADAAFNGMDILLQELSEQLEDFQASANIDPSTWIDENVYARAAEATPVSGSKTRVLAITLGLGVIGTYGLAVLADTVYGERKPIRDRLGKRRQKRKAANEQPAVAPSDAAVRLEAMADDENDLPSRPADDHREGDAESGAA